MPTIKKIAKKANVSIATVDRVLHKRGKVAPKTEKKILQIIKEFDYKPNLYARNLRLGKSYCFGVLVPFPQQDGGYWHNVIAGADRAQQELSGHKVTVKFYHFDKYEFLSFKEKCQEINKSKLDGVIIAPVVSDKSADFLQTTMGKIPFVFIDSPLPDTRALCFIGQDAYQSGILSAKLMELLIHNKADIAVLRILPEDYHINLRALGFESYFNGRNDYSIVSYKIKGNGMPDYYARKVNEIINQNKDIGGIFVTNASTHLIAEQLPEKRNGKIIHIIGYDLLPANVDLLKTKKIAFLISQRPEMQGYLGINTLFRHLVLRQDVPASIMMQLDIVTKENVDFYQDF
ncbi:substrate-binding domain-containing protein [candidate division KSB1 bacterium]|nr:substrate-binding domain-containing protein [candidate division KSB1 bacterium]